MSKTTRLIKDTEKKKKYLGYYEGMMAQRRMPMTQAKWTKATPAQVGLHQAGIDWDVDKPSAKLKRKK